MINAIKDKRARRHQTNKLPTGKNGGIELILLQEVDKLGKIGDLVEVKRGYAVNFLIPSGAAAVATEKARQLAEARKAEQKAAHDKKVAAAQDTVKKLAANPLTLTATTDDNGNFTEVSTRRKLPKPCRIRVSKFLPNRSVLKARSRLPVFTRCRSACLKGSKERSTLRSTAPDDIRVFPKETHTGVTLCVSFFGEIAV